MALNYFSRECKCRFAIFPSHKIDSIISVSLFPNFLFVDVCVIVRVMRKMFGRQYTLCGPAFDENELPIPIPIIGQSPSSWCFHFSAAVVPDCLVIKCNVMKKISCISTEKKNNYIHISLQICCNHCSINCRFLYFFICSIFVLSLFFLYVPKEANSPDGNVDMG